MDDKELRMFQLMQKQFEKIDKAIKENPKKAREITKNSSPYVKEQIEKIIKKD